MPIARKTVPSWMESGPLAGNLRLSSRARCEFELGSIRVGSRSLPVSQMDLLTLPFCILTKFSLARDSERCILVIAPLGGGFPVLLRDLVIGLLRHSNVAVSDWLNACHVPIDQGRFGFDENVGAVLSMIRHLGPGLDVIAVCQGVIPALMASALISVESPEAAPRSLVLIGGPVDPLANPTKIVRQLRGRSPQWFRDHVMEAVPAGFPGKGRLVYPASLQLVTFMSYLGRHMITGGELFWKILHDDGEDPIRFPLLQLCLRLMDLPFEFFIETIQHVYQDPICCSGSAHVLNHPVNLQALHRTALMSVEGELDDIVAPGQTRAVHHLCGAEERPGDTHLLVPNCGHFSLFYGGAWQQHVLPKVLEFLYHR